MRPAQIAREIWLRNFCTDLSCLRFNEARANCAGNFNHERNADIRKHRFNEARANCAGNYTGDQHTSWPIGASMRPAQIAREINLPAMEDQRIPKLQ